MITGGDLRQSRLDVGYKTFTISPWLPYLSARFTRAFLACFRASGSERCTQQQPWLPQGLAAATVPGIFSADGMADSGLALFESLSYRTFSVGENGFTWAGSRFDRPAPELRELRSLLQLIQMTPVHLVLGQAAPASGICP